MLMELTKKIMMANRADDTKAEEGEIDEKVE